MSSSQVVSDHTALAVLDYLHFAYPIVLLAFFLCSFTVRSIVQARATNDDEDPSPELQYNGKPLPVKPQPADKIVLESLDFSKSRKLLFDWISVAVATTFLANAVHIVARALIHREDGWWCGKPTVVYVVGSFFVWGLLLISLLDTCPSPTSAHLASWTVSVVMEIVLVGASLAIYSHRHQEAHYHRGIQDGPIRTHMTDWEVAEVFIDLLRIFLVLALMSFYLIFVVSRNAGIRAAKAAAGFHGAEDETTGLLANGALPNGSARSKANGYGSNEAGSRPKHHEGTPSGWERPDKPPSRSWWEYLQGYRLLFPYLWPSKDRRLQIVVVICFLLVVAQRAVNIVVPILSGVIVNKLAGDNQIALPYAFICGYVFFRILHGGNGILGALRSYLWIPVSQYSYREISVAAFEHVHGLSLEFHLGKKTGEVLSALGKGSSINNFLEQVTFQVLPMLVDLCVAIGYFLIAFDAYYASVIAIVTFWYIYLTIRMAQWRADIRRQMVNADREQDAVKNDSMISYETVKYFNAEPWEFERYVNAVDKYQVAEYRVLTSLNIMNVTQNMVFMLGLLIVCFIAAYQVTSRQRKVGDFVVLLTYMSQLQGPLNFFGTFYRMIQSAMINSERMLELFKEKPTVVDAPGARDLPSSEGRVDFNDVEFSYDVRKPALQGLTFHCAPGSTTALVGESGGGKSTVFRLLFRFYHANSGSIQIDGHDFNDITIDSLRSQIGVVPQDTVLFNESLMYNLKYANQNASDEDVFAACRAASIHERILTFPDGYNTRVGERGLRLSGGEKQRVAIARTIIKNPRIILLDEATAALDTETEQHIQDALTTLGHGRTMLIIAHRLSTITLADQILVLHQGRVDERGTHDELLAKKGRYASMWRKQAKAERWAEKARVLTDQAERLRGSVDGGGGSASASPSEDEHDLEVRKSEYERTRRHSASHKQNGSGDSTDRPHGHP
ncbi:MAG: hypothetical protein M1828_003665 [Chrysothrix sp. TS-e1954]|nr:MAG: hypothetical protein M1828_003665 [Chrysothrix sp. TS-e1954]